MNVSRTSIAALLSFGVLLSPPLSADEDSFLPTPDSAEEKVVSLREAVGKIHDAVSSLKTALKDESGVPADLIKKASALVIIPELYKAGFIVGGTSGWGIMLERRGSGWTQPVFVEMGGVNFGLQAGAQSAEAVLVFTGGSGLKQLKEGSLKLGADVSITAGPVGNQSEAAITETGDTVFSYSRSKGLFAGVSLSGAGLTVDAPANSAFYGRKMSAEAIANGAHSPQHPEARRAAEELARALHKL